MIIVLHDFSHAIVLAVVFSAVFVVAVPLAFVVHEIRERMGMQKSFNTTIDEEVHAALSRGDKEAAFASFVKGGLAYQNDAGRRKFEQFLNSGDTLSQFRLRR